VPPLLPPLVLRTENGFFGARRPAIGTFGDCEPCTRFEEPPSSPPGQEPRGPEPPDPSGTGLVSRYLHLEGGSICVEPGDPVTKGDVIGRIGPGPADPHLHFELRIVVDPSDRRFWSDQNSIAVDPTRLLHRSEADALPVLSAGPASAVTSIGVETVARVPLFRAETADARAPYSVPMYEPSTGHERGLASVFTKALELGRAVEVEYRDSVFFGPHRVPVSVRLA
jgi:hypothetical protein